MTFDRSLLRAAARLRAPALPAALAMLAAACAQQAPSPSPAPAAPAACTSEPCTITVSIVDHCRAPQGIVVAPAMASTRQRVILRWTLASGAYEFHDDGISFDEIAQFERLPSPNNLREVRILDSKTKNGDFRYVVRLRGCPEVVAYIRHE